MSPRTAVPWLFALAATVTVAMAGDTMGTGTSFAAARAAAPDSHSEPVPILSRSAAEPPHPVMAWVKQHPKEKPAGKPAPRMGYETSYGYDALRKTLIRYGGHNQGGGGEQNSEVWTYQLAKDAWTLKEPNDAPPGVCCAQQNVFDERLRKFIRFPAFSGSHGWQSWREISLKNSSVWTYDLDTNTWRAMRPFPEVWTHPLRGAAYDPESGVTVLHGGEGANHGTVVYDLRANTWKEMKPAGEQPQVKSQPGFAYDAANRLYVLFGSQFESDPRTWVYDLQKNAWRVLDVKQHPPADKSCPVLAADTRNGIVLCNVEGKDGLETWALDVAKPAWTRLKVPREPDMSGNRNRVLLYLPDEDLFVLENRTKDEQQILTFRYAEGRTVAQASSLSRGKDRLEAGPTQTNRLEAGPTLVLDLCVSVPEAKRVELQWKKPGGDIAGYHVERADVAVYSSLQVLRIAKQYPQASDMAVGRIKGLGRFERLTQKPVEATQFVDTAADLAAGQKEPAGMVPNGTSSRPDQFDANAKPYRYAVYAYRAIAVNRQGVESGPSPLTFTYPSAVQHVFSKEEDGGKTRLKWQPNREKGIKGYLVYRYDGRWEKDPIVRLTPQPIAAAEFLDEHAGEPTRRYEIVAVDALGQEGEPSQPVWSRREWRRFYVPYAGEWHQ